jgi:surface protein
MGWMFYGAESFDQNLGGWNISNVQDMDMMFAGGALSSENYDAILIGWGAQQVKQYVRFSAGNCKYSSAAVASRDLLTNAPNNWYISDGGPLIVDVDDGENVVFSIYPNPTTALVSIEANNLQNYSTIIISDALGRIVNQSDIAASKISIDLSNQNPGMYFVEIRGEQNSVFEKIVVE